MLEGVQYNTVRHYDRNAEEEGHLKLNEQRFEFVIFPSTSEATSFKLSKRQCSSEERVLNHQSVQVKELIGYFEIEGVEQVPKYTHLSEPMFSSYMKYVEQSFTETVVYFAQFTGIPGSTAAATLTVAMMMMMLVGMMMIKVAITMMIR